MEWKTKTIVPVGMSVLHIRTTKSAAFDMIFAKVDTTVKNIISLEQNLESSSEIWDHVRNSYNF